MRWLNSLLFLVIAAASMPVAGGPVVRVPNTTLKLPQQPGSFGYRLTEAFPDQRFRALVIAAIPGETNRLVFAHQAGEVTIMRDLRSPEQDLFLDLIESTVAGGEQGLLGLTFHPRYAENGRFFVFRTVMASTPGFPDQLHDRLSEFHVSKAEPNQADPNSEVILFQQADPASNHNAGDLHFGPDGYLCVSLGDGGGANDTYGNSQRIDGGFFSGLLRIDVDNRPGSLPPNPHPSVVGNYRVPADNPFVGVTSFLGQPVDPLQVRTEFFAVGLRNPWRFSFDPEGGDLWIGDVGQDKWESVFVTRKGANHGWAFLEGRVAGSKAGMPADFQTDPQFNHVGPVHTYPHGTGPEQGNSLTGGVVYRGSRMAALHGAYLFADYLSGNLWALRRQDSGPPVVQRLAGKAGIAAFGADPRNGDVLLSDISSGTIWRLEYNNEFTGEPLPPTLADTGAFTDTAALTPAPGFVPYAVNQSFWSDGAQKRRWLCVPDASRHLGFAAEEAWSAPAGTVLMKHFDIEMTNGFPASSRRLETRFIVRNTNGVYGVTYRWDSATNAVLVPEEGADETLTRVIDGVARTQTWHYPSRAECLACHNRPAGLLLSFNTPQLNREFAYPDGATNQIAVLAAAGYFAETPPPLPSLRALPALDDESLSVEWRARSYLAVNCSPCHRPGGSGGGFFDARLQTSTGLAGLVNGALNDNRGDSSNRVLAPGSAERSLLIQRQSVRGPGQMPPLATSVPDAAATGLLVRWVQQLTDTPADEPAGLHAALADGRLRLHISQPANHAFQLEASERLDPSAWQPIYLPGTAPTYPALPREIEIDAGPVGSMRFFRSRTETP
jgi:uncharacterized repeat protein (TIGR03806 family)